MKLAVAIIATVALFGALVESYPQGATFQRLPYYPPPTAPPRPIRTRRQVLTGTAASSPNGGADARLEYAHLIAGDEKKNLIGSAFAEGNTDRGPVTHGAALAFNNGPVSAIISKQKIPGIEDSFRQTVQANLFNDKTHAVSANAFRSQVEKPNGFQFERNGFGVNYDHKNGHAASLTHTNIPNFGSQLGANAKANLWSSADRNTNLDFNAGYSKFTSGPFSGQSDSNFGFGLNHMFGR